MVAVKEIHRALANDAVEVETAARGFVIPIEEAVREDAALKILGER